MIQNQVVLVLAGGAAHFFTGWVLNNQMLLGQFFKKDSTKKCGLSKDMNINLAAQFTASVALSIATCVAISVFEKYQCPSVPLDTLSKLLSIFFKSEATNTGFMKALHTIIFIWAGFIIPTSISEVIWCGHNWKNWMLEMAMELIGLSSIALTIAYLV